MKTKSDLVRFEVEASEMAVRPAGDRERSALLLIHGFPSSSASFQRVIGPLARLGVESFHLYLHDYGAAVGLHLSTRAPCRIRSLIVQDANAHESGMGPQGTASMGITLLTEEEHRALQRLGEFDARTCIWIETPSDVRSLGGAPFRDRRYGRVFVYHNGAESYYAARGFRGLSHV